MHTLSPRDCKGRARGCWEAVVWGAGSRAISGATACPCLCRSNSPAGRHQEQSSLLTHCPIAGEFSSFLLPSVSKKERGSETKELDAPS